MKVRSIGFTCVLLAIGALCASADENDNGRFSTKLTGFQEVLPILTEGHGTFNATLDSSGTSLSFTLTYTGLTGGAVASHIHFGEPGVNGAVVAFLCGGGSKPACPSGAGALTATVTGTITAADVLAVPSQGVTGGSFSDLLRILRSPDAYVNVHTPSHPSGEIRGQLKGDD
jgi:CHRD domain